MRNVFLSLLAIFAAFCVARFCFALNSNSIEYVIERLLDAVPDIEEDFSVVIDASGKLISSFDALQVLIEDEIGFLEVLQAIGDIITAFANILLAFSIFLVAVVKDILTFFRVLFELVFGSVVVPIVDPRTLSV